MSPEDQQLYGQTISQTTAKTTTPTTIPAPKLEPHPSPKAGTAERKEQGSFANWLLLQNSNGRKIPFCWQATHTRSKATPGTPDFWVGVSGHAMWIEFKRDRSCDLSPEQDEFRVCCAYQGIEWHVVYSAGEAIAIAEKAAEPPQTPCDRERSQGISPYP
jgi:hypothetical protein